MAGLLVAALVWVGWSAGHALTGPGTDSASARLAEWARSHGLSRVVDLGERISYWLSPPRVGGAPGNGSPLAAGAVPAPVPSAANLSAATGSGRAPAPVPPAASPPLPGEGQWRLLSAVGSVPAVEAAFLRPDAAHTSYVDGLVWMDPRLVRFELHPGTLEPGHGPWRLPPDLPPAGRRGLLAAFNSGFRLDAAQGGYYADGRTVGGLRAGAASLVIGTDGRATVGAWGRDVAMSPSVAAVRQNLDLIVDNGQVVSGIDNNAGHRWGATLGNGYYVWRSGIGVTATGALVYAAGNGLSARTLADLLRRAGCVRAMELDINPEWTSFVSYQAGADAARPAEKNLLPDMQRSPHRYDTSGSRDFFAVYSR